MSTVKELWELQELESRLAALEKELKNPPFYAQLKKLKAEIEGEQEELRQGLEEKEDFRKKIKGLEGEWAALKEKMQPIEDKLYSGAGASPKELENLQQNLEAFRKKLGELEDQILILMDRKEKLEEALGRDNLVLADKKQHFRQLHIQYQNKLNQLKGEKTELELARVKLEEAIDKELLAKYNELKTKLPNPVAKTAAGICSGCHMAVSYEVLKKLKEPGRTVGCDNCGRLLWQE